MYLQKVPTSRKNCVKTRFLLASWRSMTKIAGSRSISQRHGSADPDPDPHQNAMDPKQWLKRFSISLIIFQKCMAFPFWRCVWARRADPQTRWAPQDRTARDQADTPSHQRDSALSLLPLLLLLLWRVEWGLWSGRSARESLWQTWDRLPRAHKQQSQCSYLEPVLWILIQNGKNHEKLPKKIQKS